MWLHLAEQRLAAHPLVGQYFAHNMGPLETCLGIALFTFWSSRFAIIEAQTSYLMDPDDFIEVIKKPYSVSQFVWSFAPVLSRQVPTEDGLEVSTVPAGFVMITAGHFDELARLMMASSKLSNAMIEPPGWFPDRTMVGFSGLSATSSSSQRWNGRDVQPSSSSSQWRSLNPKPYTLNRLLIGMDVVLVVR